MRNLAVPNELSDRQAVPEPLDSGLELTVDVIRSHPRLAAALGTLSRGLREHFALNPRLGRTLVSHQRWLLSQATVALHLEYDPADRISGLTVGRLRDLITSTSAASRNTVLNFMEEMRHYRYVHDVPNPPATRSRRRRLVVSEGAMEGMYNWFATNLAALDMLDMGGRMAAMKRDPSLFVIAQPLAARACLTDPAWVDPPATVGLFQWTEGGALAMDELVMRSAGAEADAEGHHAVGHLNIRAMADAYLMSHTHLQRLFRKAAEAGMVGWDGPRRKAELWVSEAFLIEYRNWQAIKLAHIDHAFRQALLGGCRISA